MLFKESGEQILVDTYALEVYLPYEYAGSGYRGLSFYSVLGTRVKYFGVGNMRPFKNPQEMEKPEEIPTYPLGVPMLITGEPSDIDTRDARLMKNGRERKCIVLTFMKGDAFLVNTETIKDANVMMMLLARLEQGKLDHLPPEAVVSVIRDCERMNGISLRMPSEELEIFVAERYRDPDHPGRAYRYHTGAVDPTEMISRNMRTDTMQSTTFQGVNHEDINSALITGINRKNSGKIDEPTAMECLVRGLDMDEFYDADIS